MGFLERWSKWSGGCRSFSIFLSFHFPFLFFLFYSILRSHEEQCWRLIEKDFGSESLETMRPDQIACCSIWVQESCGCFTEGIGLWAGHLHRQCPHWSPPAEEESQSGRPAKLNGFFTSSAEIRQSVQSVSNRPWWMIARRSEWVPCAMFLTSHVSQSCQVTQIERYQFCHWKSSLNHKGIIFVRFTIIGPSFLPKLCLWTSILPLHSSTGGTLEVAGFFWVHEVCLI